ncbi:MAG: hypothetical protein JO144_10765 [Actinobacteria bacterium]|nr:hypothetical protein [Actinomycetota bacterium]
MNPVTRTPDTIAGVPGLRFATAARPGSPEEKVLQRIQHDLSGGRTSLPAPTTVAHLALSQVKVVNGSSYSVITLWVPAAQESEAATALRAEGFEVVE